MEPDGTAAGEVALDFDLGGRDRDFGREPARIFRRIAWER
jgi:hypothetical protein